MTHEEIYKSYLSGMSYQQIALEIKKTRASVAGIIFRHKNKPKNKLRLRTKKKLTKKTPPKKPKVVLTFDNLPRNGCRFPEGDKWCGHEAQVGQSYCAYHHSKTHVKFVPKEKRKAQPNKHFYVQPRLQ